MVLIFRDLELKFRASFVWELSRVYGIGYQKASKMADAFGISVNFPVSNINYYTFELFSFIIKVNYITGERLKLFLRQRLNYFVNLKLVRGLRFSKGLPVRGQRTHTNGKLNKYHKRNEI